MCHLHTTFIDRKTRWISVENSLHVYVYTHLVFFWKWINRKIGLCSWTFLSGSPEHVWRLRRCCLDCTGSMLNDVLNSSDRTDVIDLVKVDGALDERMGWLFLQYAVSLTSRMASGASSFQRRRRGFVVKSGRRGCDQNFMKQTLGLMPFQFDLSWLNQIDKGGEVWLNVCHIKIARQHRIQHSFRQRWWNRLIRSHRRSIGLAHSLFIFLFV